MSLFAFKMCYWIYIYSESLNSENYEEKKLEKLFGTISNGAENFEKMSIDFLPETLFCNFMYAYVLLHF